jgi:hypothetical protein
MDDKYPTLPERFIISDLNPADPEITATLFHFWEDINN